VSANLFLLELLSAIGCRAGKNSFSPSIETASSNTAVGRNPRKGTHASDKQHSDYLSVYPVTRLTDCELSELIIVEF